VASSAPLNTSAVFQSTHSASFKADALTPTCDAPERTLVWLVGGAHHHVVCKILAILKTGPDHSLYIIPDSKRQFSCS
jgi:hypothetical protein